MGAQEVAAVASILIATPVAAIYSVARWDASRYVTVPETNIDFEADQAKNKPTRLQECLRFSCFMAFMAACWAAGWSLQYLPASMRDAGILFLMCGFPAWSSTYSGAVLFGAAHEVFSIRETGGKTRLRCETVRRRYLQRALAASACALVLASTYYGIGRASAMTMIGSGMIFSSSLLMGMDPTKASPSLRTSAKWHSFMAASVVVLAYTLPLLINWLVAKFENSKEKPARVESPLTAWTDNATQFYPIVVASMWSSITYGILLSRLYRIDVANVRRKTIVGALDPALRPRYLLDRNTKSLVVADDGVAPSSGSVPVIRIMSPCEMYSSGTLFDLVYTPWYSGVAYLCAASMLVFAMPTLLSFSPVMDLIKKETLEAGAGWNKSTWLSSNICVAMYSSTYLALLPVPMLLAVAFLALARGESGFVWNSTFDWAPFAPQDRLDALDSEKK